jgi:hypothetical protein
VIAPGWHLARTTVHIIPSNDEPVDGASPKVFSAYVRDSIVFENVPDEEDFRRALATEKSHTVDTINSLAVDYQTLQTNMAMANVNALRIANGGSYGCHTAVLRANCNRLA